MGVTYERMAPFACLGACPVTANRTMGVFNTCWSDLGMITERDRLQGKGGGDGVKCEACVLQTGYKRSGDRPYRRDSNGESQARGPPSAG